MSILSKSSNPIYNTTMALIYILYGVIKIAVGVAVLMLSPEQIGKIPIAKIFVKEAADKTLAGRMYEYVLMAFGVFTIMHGLVIFNVLPLWFIKIFVTKTVQYGVLIVLGLILTIFYSLVLYTKIPITKNKEDSKQYLTLGLICGILYLLSPPLWELIEYMSPHFNNLPVEQQNMWIISVIIIVMIIAEIVYKYLKKKSYTNRAKEIIYSQIPLIESIM